MKKSIYIILISLLLITPNIIKAEELSATEMINIDEEVQASDFGINDPTILPNHPFYFIKDIGRNVRSFFTFDPVKKAETESRFANEKLIELKKMIEANMDEEKIEKATESYQERVQKTEKLTKEIKEKAQENEEVNNFSEKYNQQQILHQKVLQKLEEKVPEQAFEKIKEARENHLDKFKEGLSNLQDEKNIAGAIDKALNNIKGSSLKEIKDIEILERIQEKFPEEIKEQIEDKVEERIKNLKEDLENASSEDQEKLKEYIQKTNSNLETQLNIIDNLKGRIVEDGLEETINQVRESVLERIKENKGSNTNSDQVQEEFNTNESLLEKVKTLILEKDLDKVTVPEVFDLIEDSEVDLNKAKEYIQEGNFTEAFKQVQSSKSLSNSTKEILKRVAGFEVNTTTENSSEIVCSNENSPVCGENGITYGNICKAQKENVKIDYRGECKEEECAQQGERVNRNPLLGSINQRCCEDLKEFRITENYGICESSNKEFECETDADCPLSKSSTQSKCENNKCVIPENNDEIIACIQVITPAKGPDGECKEFSNPCNVPEGWTKVNSCEESAIKLKDSLLQEKIEIQNQIRKQNIQDVVNEVSNQIKAKVEEVVGTKTQNNQNTQNK